MPATAVSLRSRSSRLPCCAGRGPSHLHDDEVLEAVLRAAFCRPGAQAIDQGAALGVDVFLVGDVAAGRVGVEPRMRRIVEFELVEALPLSFVQFAEMIVQFVAQDREE